MQQERELSSTFENSCLFLTYNKNDFSKDKFKINENK